MTSSCVMSSGDPSYSPMEPSNGRQSVGGVWPRGNVPCFCVTCGSQRRGLSDVSRSRERTSTRGKRGQKRRKERGTGRITGVGHDPMLHSRCRVDLLVITSVLTSDWWKSLMSCPLQCHGGEAACRRGKERRRLSAATERGTRSYEEASAT